MSKLKRKSNRDSLKEILDGLPINKFKLDEEAVKQVDLMSKVSILLADARDKTLRAKNQIEIVEMEIISDIHKNPNAYDIPKTTDTIVTKAVKATEEYIEVFNEYLDTKKGEDELSLLLDNIRQRGHQIKILTELWLNNYYVDTADYKEPKRKQRIEKDY